MQKLLLFSLMVHQAVAVYVPVAGPLCLTDFTDESGYVLNRGEIIKIMQNESSLHGSLQALCRFTGAASADALPPYQDIMEQLSRIRFVTIDSEASIEAFEHAIMYAYDKQIYIIGGYTQYLSVLISGLRWRALNPFSYLNPWSWFTENHAKGSQLLYEFEQLVDIAYRINSAHYDRLRATLISYKHWRKIRLLPFCVFFVNLVRFNAQL